MKRKNKKIETSKSTEQLWIELLGYPNSDVQQSVYEFSCKYIRIGSSIVDLGAGMGDLKLYLQKAWNSPVNYTGIEYSPSLVNAAKYVNDIDLISGKWDDEYPSADWIVNVLGLTVRPIELSPTADVQQYITQHITDMFNKCNIGLSFTFMRPSNINDLSDYVTIELNSLIKFCEANNFLYIIDCSYNDYVTNLTIFKI